MLDAEFWLDQAVNFRQKAISARDDEEREELRALATVCDAVASKIDEHLPGG